MDTAKSLNDLSKIYLESVYSSEQSIDEAAYPGYDEKGKPLKKEPKDNRHVVTYADKRGNTLAYQKLKAGDKNYKKADHLNNEEFIHRLEESGKFSIEEIQTILEAEVSVELEEEDKDLKKRAQFHASRKEFKAYQQKKELKYWKTKKKNPVKAPNQQLKGFSNYVEGLEVSAEEVEQVDELYKGKHGQSEKEYQAGRSDAGKRISGDEKHGPASYSRRGVKQQEPTKPGEKPKHTPKLGSAEKAELAYLKSRRTQKEEVLDEVKVTRLDDKKKKEEKDKNIKAMLARQAEWESEKKKALHASHEPEGGNLDENRRAARAAGGYKDDSEKQTDPSKPGFTGISGSIEDIRRQNKEIEARKERKEEYVIDNLIKSGKFSDEEIEKIVEVQVALNNPEK